jgi:serine/threonine protein kinase
VVTSGTKIGRYRVAEKVGAGAVGEVYRALDTRMGRVVALKFLHRRFVDNARLCARFRREGLIGASLTHPNICAVYDLDTHDGRPFLVMELLRGRPLNRLLVDGPLAVPVVIGVAIDLVGALAKAHRSGVVHRDLKPANVFLTDDGITKLLDFGVARPAEPVDRIGPDHDTDPGSDTCNGRVVGTIGYMSPEQARGEDLDGRSDLFSLGVLLYEAATGVHPFDAATPALVFDRLFNATPASPLVFSPALPRELARVLLKALAKPRSARYQRAEELRDHLHRIRDIAAALHAGDARAPRVAVGAST